MALRSPTASSSGSSTSTFSSLESLPNTLPTASLDDLLELAADDRALKKLGGDYGLDIDFGPRRASSLSSSNAIRWLRELRETYPEILRQNEGLILAAGGDEDLRGRKLHPQKDVSSTWSSISSSARTERGEYQAKGGLQRNNAPQHPLPQPAPSHAAMARSNAASTSGDTLEQTHSRLTASNAPVGSSAQYPAHSYTPYPTVYSSPHQSLNARHPAHVHHNQGYQPSEPESSYQESQPSGAPLMYPSSSTSSTTTNASYSSFSSPPTQRYSYSYASLDSLSQGRPQNDFYSIQPTQASPHFQYPHSSNQFDASSSGPSHPHSLHAPKPQYPISNVGYDVVAAPVEHEEAEVFGFEDEMTPQQTPISRYQYQQWLRQNEHYQRAVARSSGEDNTEMDVTSYSRQDAGRFASQVPQYPLGTAGPAPIANSYARGWGSG